MHCYFFGSTASQLYGAYHPPPITKDKLIGVLICSPAGHEYLRSHWALRQLAVRLSGEGYHVLRFDYFGTGDSAGSTAEGDPEQWIADIQTAAEELRDISGVRRINLIGLRLGASLALEASENIKSVNKIILWDPLISGYDFILQLHKFYEKMCAHVDYSPSGREPEQVQLPEQLLGLCLSKKMIAFIRNESLFDLIGACKQKLCVVFSSLDTVSETDFESIEKMSEKSCICQLIEDQGDWNSFEDIAKIIYPNKIIQHIKQEIIS